MVLWSLALAQPPTDAISFVLIDRYANEAPDAPGSVDPADPQAWHGGDLAGVLAHLDDLRGGVWLSPVWAARTEPAGPWGAFHGYWTADPTRVEPRFGTEAQLVELGRQLRSEGRELWLDLVLNHVGYDTPWVTAHPDWFHHHGDIVNWGDPIEAVTHDVHGLPDLDQDNPEVYAALRDAALHWVRTVRPTGFRIDAVRHLPPGFLARLRTELRQEDPTLQFLGEFFEGDPAKLAERQREDQLDRVFDFPLHYALQDAVCRGKPARLAEVLAQDVLYDDPASLVTFLDNHDVPRIRSVCAGDLDAVARALALLLTLRGSPSLTWGTDAGLEGAEEPTNRADMDFEHRPLLPLIDDLLRLRAENPALGRTAPVQVLEVSSQHVVLGRPADRSATLVLTGARSYALPAQRGCEDRVLTGVAGFRALEGPVPANAVGLRLCPGPPQPALPHRGEPVVTRLWTAHRVVGAGTRLGGWNPAEGLDPVRGAVRVPAHVGDVLTYKILTPGVDGWQWPVGGNRDLLVERCDVVDAWVEAWTVWDLHPAYRERCASTQ